MGFFDLNIPYHESDKKATAAAIAANKNMRVKLVTKAMELGYTGIAYNRTLKGVMSERDRCSIPLLTLSSLVKVAPQLSASIGFHRDLLGVPRDTPFRQYTRLTVCVENAAQGQVLNSGNPILKSYDIVAVRPMNQQAFDQACERAEVDIISIDFSNKLPFRMKLNMVKAAIKRGIYFEIAYSNLIVDAHLRRQMISNAKLLVDWAKGKNIILSSAVSSVTEFRGPNDAVNLSSLLGLSTERAKAAISKNCRILIANALRRKHFFKEAIRVEMIPLSEQSHSGEPLSVDWLKWDPLSSGDGDLLLDDLAKAFSASIAESKTMKAINFASVVDTTPSNGFQIEDIMPSAASQPNSPNGESLSSTADVSNGLHPINQISEETQILKGDNSQNSNLIEGTTKACATHEGEKSMTLGAMEKPVFSRDVAGRHERGSGLQTKDATSLIPSRRSGSDATIGAHTHVSTGPGNDTTGDEEQPSTPFTNEKRVSSEDYTVRLKSGFGLQHKDATSELLARVSQLDASTDASIQVSTGSGDDYTNRAVDMCSESNAKGSKSFAEMVDTEQGTTIVALPGISSFRNVEEKPASDLGDHRAVANTVPCLEKNKIDEPPIRNHGEMDAIMLVEKKPETMDLDEKLHQEISLLEGEAYKVENGEETALCRGTLGASGDVTGARDESFVTHLITTQESVLGEALKDSETLAGNPYAPREALTEVAMVGEAQPVMTLPICAQLPEGCHLKTSATPHPGKSISNKRMARQASLLPFKHFLKPLRFKRRARRRARGRERRGLRL